MSTNRRDYARAHYEANKAAYLARAKAFNEKRIAKFRKIIRDAKNVPCTDCAVSYPFYIMQFDHVGDEKNFNIASAVTNSMSEKRLLHEISLCEVVCANCHAERTFQRRVPVSGVEPDLSTL